MSAIVTFMLKVVLKLLRRIKMQAMDVFRIPIRLEYNGSIYVRAENRKKAEETAKLCVFPRTPQYTVANHIGVDLVSISALGNVRILEENKDEMEDLQD